MPVKRTLAKRSRRLDDYKRQQLLEGPEELKLPGVGYLAGRGRTLEALPLAVRAEVLAEMELDWTENKAELTAWWNAGEGAPHFSPMPWIFPLPGGPDRKPWAAERFDD